MATLEKRNELDETAVNDDRLTFAAWLAKANAACVSISGVSLDDLPDANTYDAWHDGEDPAEFARDVLEEEGFSG